jgi:hypothetical protein
MYDSSDIWQAITPFFFIFYFTSASFIHSCFLIVDCTIKTTSFLPRVCLDSILDFICRRYSPSSSMFTIVLALTSSLVILVSFIVPAVSLHVANLTSSHPHPHLNFNPILSTGHGWTHSHIFRIVTALGVLSLISSARALRRVVSVSTPST